MTEEWGMHLSLRDDVDVVGGIDSTSENQHATTPNKCDKVTIFV
jgi:hypothetical protein